MWNKLQNSFSEILNKVFGILALCFISSMFWAGTSASATQVVLTNLEGDILSAELLGFDEETRKIQLKKDREIFEYSLRDLDLSSKIIVLRSSEMQEVLSTKSQLKGKALPLYGFLTAATIAVLLLIGFPTFLAAAFLITGQVGTKHHFRAWIKIVALGGLIVGIRYASLGGIQWTEVIANGLFVFRAGDGLALVIALAGTVWLIKHHYRETPKLAATTLGVYIVTFAFATAGITWLVLRWYGDDWSVAADILLTRLILQPYELI